MALKRRNSGRCVVSKREEKLGKGKIVIRTGSSRHLPKGRRVRPEKEYAELSRNSSVLSKKGEEESVE